MGSATQKEIHEYYQNRCDENLIECVFSARSFMRDKNDILSLYGILIEYRNSAYFLSAWDREAILNEHNSMVSLLML